MNTVWGISDIFHFQMFLFIAVVAKNLNVTFKFFGCRILLYFCAPVFLTTNYFWLQTSVHHLHHDSQLHSPPCPTQPIFSREYKTSFSSWSSCSTTWPNRCDNHNVFTSDPADTRRWTNVVLMLVQRRRFNDQSKSMWSLGLKGSHTYIGVIGSWFCHSDSLSFYGWFLWQKIVWMKNQIKNYLILWSTNID